MNGHLRPRHSWLVLIALTFIIPATATPLCAQGQNAQQKKKRRRLPGQYKRVHQRAFKKILAGHADAAVEMLRQFHKRVPGDGETYYMLTVAYSRVGMLDNAAAAMTKALAAGVPPGRFIGGTLTGLKPLQMHPAYQKLLKEFQHRPVHGPMLGDVTGTSIKVWVRTARAADVQVIASTNKKLSDPVKSKPVRTSRETDFTAEVPLTELKPQTRYFYTVLINGKHDDDTPVASFRTFPKQGSPAKFRLAFGGGAGYVPQHERMWNTIRDKQPDVLFLLGDNVYIDDPKTPAMQHYCYYRRQSRPEFRRLVAHTPVYSIWDDHDFATNDSSGGPAIDKPAWKLPVYRVYRNNWVNPYYGGGEKQPGCNYDFYLGDVHFIMLDGRYYRNLKKQDNGRSTMLGPAQRKWLLETIQASKGKLLVLCSPVPWTFYAKGKSRDTWNGFREERTEIFNFLAKNKVEGVMLMSADRHRSDLWKIERDNGYPLYEFNSSRLTNQHVHGTMKRAVFSYNKKQSFGLVEFDTTTDDPTVTYKVVTIDGDVVHSHTLQRSELR